MKYLVKIGSISKFTLNGKLTVKLVISCKSPTGYKQVVYKVLYHKLNSIIWLSHKFQTLSNIA